MNHSLARRPTPDAPFSVVSTLERDHVAHMFQAAARQFADRPATRVQEPDGDWRVATYAELSGQVRAIARALVADGVQPGDRVAIFAHNLPEWLQADLAIATVGAVSVPIYATNTVDQVVQIAADCDLVAAFAGTTQETERMVAAQASLPLLRRVISVEPTPLSRTLPQVIDVATLCGSVSASDVTRLDAEVDARLGSADPADLFSLIYTSGTTGQPRGAMISHRAMISQMRALDEFFDFGPSEHSLCFLPLSHALERAWSTYILSHGCLNTFLPDTRKVAETMTVIRPTMMVAVPKLYETVAATARASVAGSTVKQRIFDWAIGVGAANQRIHRTGRRPGPWLRTQLRIADRLVLRKVRDAVGGPKRVLACGGAPLRPDVEEFFGAIGLHILQGYGLTEASPLVTFNRPDVYKVNTAGRVMPGGQLRIGPEQEIQYRGPNVMDGYWGNPEATAQVFADDPDGRGCWLRTGDAGHVDADGFLLVTDRIKDIIVTSGGKNIAPQPIENMLLADPLFEQAVLLGDNRPFLTLLVKPSLPQLGAIAERLQEPYEQLTDLLTNPRMVAEIIRRARGLTQKLPSHEQFKDLRVLLEEFTPDNGLLTPTLKVKRREVERRFAQLVDDMYTRVEQMRSGLRADEMPA